MHKVWPIMCVDRGAVTSITIVYTEARCKGTAALDDEDRADLPFPEERSIHQRRDVITACYGNTMPDIEIGETTFEPCVAAVLRRVVVTGAAGKRGRIVGRL